MIFDGIDTLIISGCGKIAIKKDGSITGATGADKTGQTLHVKLGTQIVTNTVITNSFVNGNIFTFNNMGCTIQNQGVGVIDSHEDDEIECSLGKDCLIGCIIINGAASLAKLPPKFLSLKLKVSVEGAGDVKLSKNEFDVLTINVNGSGDVIGGKTKIASINVVGTGDVSGVHVTESGMISLMGSGDVVVTANNAGAIATNKIGSGSIKVRANKKLKI